MVDRVTRRSLLRWAAVGAAGLALLTANDVVARGPDTGSPYDILAPGFSHSFSGPAERPRRPAKTLAGGSPICVRLCDGGYFPISSIASYPSEEAACRSLCPDAPTAVYHQAKGSDEIDNAVSAAGESYTALPAAFRYRTTFVATCACHRAIAPAYSVAEDPTLRKGDYVKTPTGLEVFAGGRTMPHQANEFIAILNAGTTR